VGVDIKMFGVSPRKAVLNSAMKEKRLQAVGHFIRVVMDCSWKRYFELGEGIKCARACTKNYNRKKGYVLCSFHHKC
jgi:hypothetical protein